MPIELNIESHVKLSTLTTIGVGGPAKYFVRIKDIESLNTALNLAKNSRIEILILGDGSNVIISDRPFEGLVLKLEIRGVERIRKSKYTSTYRVGAGVNWDDFVKFTVKNKLSGVECLSGIPGKVGAAPIQNIGAYGQEVKNVITNVEAINLKNSETVNFSNSQCRFTYRNSLFERKSKYIITSVDFKLAKNVFPEIKYKELSEKLNSNSSNINQIRKAVLELREQKSLLIDEAGSKNKSVGSFFLNPVVRKSQLKQIERAAKSQAPNWPIGKAHTKISAGWLIEQAGYKKGYKKGNVGLSKKHALVIVNKKDATAKEIIDFATDIKYLVNKKFGVNLKPEPVFIGFTKKEIYQLTKT